MLLDMMPCVDQYYFSINTIKNIVSNEKVALCVLCTWQVIYSTPLFSLNEKNKDSGKLDSKAT